MSITIPDSRSISLLDRLAIKFTHLTGGNISSKRAVKIAKSLHTIKKASADIERALQKKDKKHPHLKIKLLVAQGFTRRSGTIVESEIKNEQERIDQQEELIKNFSNKAPQLANDIFYKNYNFLIRGMTVHALRKKYGINFSVNNKLKADNKLLNWVISEAHIELKGVKEKNASTPTPELKLREQELCSAIESNALLVNENLQKIADNSSKIMNVIIEVAIRNKENISEASRLLLDKFENNLNKIAMAPAVIQYSRKNIEQLKYMQSNIIEQENEITKAIEQPNNN